MTVTAKPAPTFFYKMINIMSAFCMWMMCCAPHRTFTNVHSALTRTNMKRKSYVPKKTICLTSALIKKASFFTALCVFGYGPDTGNGRFCLVRPPFQYYDSALRVRATHLPLTHIDANSGNFNKKNGRWMVERIAIRRMNSMRKRWMMPQVRVENRALAKAMSFVFAHSLFEEHLMVDRNPTAMNGSCLSLGGGRLYLL